MLEVLLWCFVFASAAGSGVLVLCLDSRISRKVLGVVLAIYFTKRALELLPLLDRADHVLRAPSPILGGWFLLTAGVVLVVISLSGDWYAQSDRHSTH